MLEWRFLKLHFAASTVMWWGCVRGVLGGSQVVAQQAGWGFGVVFGLVVGYVEQAVAQDWGGPGFVCGEESDYLQVAFFQEDNCGDGERYYTDGVEVF